MKSLTVLLALLLLSGCNYLKAIKTLAPEAFGMEKISDHLYVDPEMPAEMREALVQHYAAAKKNIEDMYGEVKSTPDVIACSSEECYKDFGGVTSRAKNYAGVSFLLSPRGMTTPMITHEWSHNELYTRLDSFWNFKKIPQWFDEGLAVVASNEPAHSQDVWNYIVENDIARPSLNELVSLKDWLNAVSKYGALANTEENADKINVVYATAGNAVRRWHRCAGQQGVLQLIEAIRSGKAFNESYESISEESKCEKNI